MLLRHSTSIAQQLMPIYNTTMHKIKINVALNLMWLTAGCYETSNMPQGRSTKVKDTNMPQRKGGVPIWHPSWI